jgi:hypothetical protein
MPPSQDEGKVRFPPAQNVYFNNSRAMTMRWISLVPS